MFRTAALAAALCCALAPFAHAESGIASYYGGRHHGSKIIRCFMPGEMG